MAKKEELKEIKAKIQAFQEQHPLQLTTLAVFTQPPAPAKSKSNKPPLATVPSDSIAGP